MRAFSSQSSRDRRPSVPPVRTTALLAAVVAVVLLLLPSALAAQWPGGVDGRVVDALTGRPVAGAAVSPETAASPDASPVSTDASGRFVLKGLDEGEHTLVVRRDGYAPARRRVEVGEGRTAPLRVALEPAPVAVPGVEVRVERTSVGGFRIEPVPGESRTAAELLGSAPGVVVRGRGEGGARTLSIRGSSPDEVLVLLDGVPLNDALTGAADLSLVPAATLASIVVLPGARSAAYGGRAQGGVVLLETRAPGPRLGARAGMGSLGRRSGEVGAGGRLGDEIGWSLSAVREERDGTFVFMRPASVGGGRDRRTNADVQRTSLAGSLDAPAGSGTLRVRLRAEAARRGLPGRTFAPSPHARQRDRRAQLSVGWEAARTAAPVTVDAHAALHRSRVRDPEPPTGLPWDDRTRAWSAGARLGVTPPTKAVELRAGLDLEASGVAADGLAEGAPSRRLDAGLFLTGEKELGLGAVPVTLGLTGRLDRPGLEGGVVGSHEAAVSAGAAPGLTLHGAWRSAFSPPTLADQYFRSGVGVEANPGLRGERVPSELEVGASFTGDAGPAELSASVAASRADVRDMIVWAPDFRFVWSPRNVDVLRRGVDLRARVRVPSGGGVATLRGWWSRARVVYDRYGYAGVQLRYRPRHSAAISASWEGRPLRVEAEGRYTGRRHPVPARVNTLPGFWSVDLSATGRVPVGDGWALEPSLRIDRLLDGTDALIFGFPHPGRTVSVDLRVTAPRGGP